jgi:quercetin dioxygenase-like cupin family protein
MNTMQVTTAVLALAALQPLSATQARAYEPLVVTPDYYQVLQTGRGSVEVLATSEETDGKLGVIITADQFGGPGHSVRLSGTVQTFFVLEGVYEFHLDDMVFDAGPGTLVSVDDNQLYGYSSKGNGRLLVVFNPGGFEQFYSEWAEGGWGPGPELETLERRYGLRRYDP